MNTSDFTAAFVAPMENSVAAKQDWLCLVPTVPSPDSRLIV